MKNCQHFDTMCSLAESGAAKCLIATSLTRRLRYAALLRVSAATGDMPYATAASDFRMIWKCMALSIDDCLCVCVERAGRVDAAELHKPQALVALRLQKDKRCTTADTGLHPGDAFTVAIGQRLRTPDAHKALLCATLIVAGNGQFVVAGDMCFVLEKNGRRDHMHIGPAHADWSRHQARVLNAFRYAAQICIEAAQPSRWVLREVVSSRQRDPQGPKIPRSTDRPRWITITDKERAKYFHRRKDEEDEQPREPGAPKQPHPRRAHWRVLGQHPDGTDHKTWVKACWVGSIYAEIRGAKYQVELDL